MAFAVSEATIYVRMSWNGVYSYPGKWDLDHVDMKMKQSSRAIIANIDRTLPPKQEHPLTFTVTDQSHRGSPRDNAEVLSCSLELIQSITLSIVMYQTYKDKSRGIMQRDGTIQYEERARKDGLPVTMDPLPALREGENLLIRMSYPEEGYSVQATFITETDTQIRLREAAASATRANPKAGETYDDLSERGIKLLQQGTLNLAAGLAQLRGQSMDVRIHSVANGLSGVARATAESSNDELDKLDHEELKKKTQVAREKLDTERANFKKALESGNSSDVFAALESKQEALKTFVQLDSALQRRGIKIEPGPSGGPIRTPPINLELFMAIGASDCTQS